MNILRAMLVCAAVLALPAHAQKNCSQADTIAAEKAIERVVTWQNLQKAWHDYRHCDKGSVDEAFTDAIMRLMVGWKSVDVIAGTLAKDADFKAFVVKHVLSPAAKDDREDLYALAKKSCPARQDAFCAELADVVKTGGAGAGGKPGAPASPDALNFETLKPIETSPPAKK